MPLALLLDENISPVVAKQLAQKRPDISIQSLHTWREGALLGAPDADVLLAAYEEGWTLVTYDTQILSDLAYLFEADFPFSGLIFVDDKTIPGDDPKKDRPLVFSYRCSGFDVSWYEPVVLEDGYAPRAAGPRSI